MRLVLVALLGAATLHASAASADAASISVAASADPAEGQPITVTATGTADPGSYVFVAYHDGTTPCAANAGAEQPSGSSGNQLIYNNPSVSGSFSASAPLPAAQSGIYTLCAYLSSGAWYYTPPVATSSIPVTVRPSRAAVTLGFSSQPLKDQVVTVTATGTAELPSTLFVAWHRGSTACAANALAAAPDDFASQRLIWSDVRVGTSFTRTATWTPTISGAYTLCAYVNYHDYPAAAPSGSADLPVLVPWPAASVALAITGNLRPGAPLAITATGTAEGQRNLFVTPLPGETPCGATPDDIDPDWDDSVDWQDGVGSLISGPFSVLATWTPPAAQTITICSAVADTQNDSVPYASASHTMITCCAAPVPVARPTSPVPFGKNPKLSWSSGYATAHEITVYSANPAGRKPASALEHADGDPNPAASEDQFENEAGELNSAQPSKLLRPGTYWWTVTRSAGDWPSKTSKPARFTVVPARLTTFKVSASVEGVTHVTTRIAVQVTPYSSVAVTATRNGKPFFTRRYSQQPRAGRTVPVPGHFTVNASCSRPGIYRYRVVAHDANGFRRAQSGQWRVISCAQLAAWARKAAQQAARDEAEDERQAELFAERCTRRGGVVGDDGQCWGLVIVIPVLLD